MISRDSASTDPDATFDVFVNGHHKSLDVSYFADRSKVLTRGNTKDSQKQIKLTGIEDDVFEMYVACVHNGSDTTRSWARTFQDSLNPSASDREKQEDADAVFMKLINLNILAKERLKDEAMANLANDEIIRFSHVTGMVPTSPVDLIFHRVDDGDLDNPDRLRRIMCDLRVYETATFGGQKLRAEVTEMTAVRDIAVHVLDFMPPISNFKRSVMNNWKSDPCRYHDHRYTPRCQPKVSAQENSGELSTRVQFCS